MIGRLRRFPLAGMPVVPVASHWLGRLRRFPLAARVPFAASARLMMVGTIATGVHASLDTLFEHLERKWLVSFDKCNPLFVLVDMFIDSLTVCFKDVHFIQMGFMG